MSECYELINNWKTFDFWLKKIKIANLTAVYMNTTSVNSLKAKLVSLSLCIKPGYVAFIPFAHVNLDKQQLPCNEVLYKLKPWFENSKYAKVVQNLKHYIHVLANHGLVLRGVIHDITLQSYILGSHYSHNIEDIVFRYLGIKIVDFNPPNKFSKYSIKTTESIYLYSSKLADIIMRLHQILFSQIQKHSKLLYIYQIIEIPLVYVLQIIEHNGVLIDISLLLKYSENIKKKIVLLESEIYKLSGTVFNLNSPKQISYILFKKLKLPIVKKTQNGIPSTDEKVLLKLAEQYDLPKKILNFRTLSKIKSTYIDKLLTMVNPLSGRIHTNYVQTIAITGRIISNNPNLQNIPVRTIEGKYIRKAFIAKKDNMLFSADYSQIELRILAHISEDINLINAFKIKKDIHNITASEIFRISTNKVTSDQRRIAKIINFGLIYGMSTFGLTMQLGITNTEAQIYIERYFKVYPGILHYSNNIIVKAREQGYVETIFGRRLWLPEIKVRNHFRRQAVERTAINAPIQGTVADLTKISMISIQNWINKNNLSSRLIMQVHDELIFEIPKKEFQIISTYVPILMCNFIKLKVPLIVKISTGQNWDY